MTRGRWTMGRGTVALLLVVAFVAGVKSSPVSEPVQYTAPEAEVSETLAAVRAAYDHARDRGFDSWRKVTVVQRRGQFVVVSLIPPKGSRTLGGGSHYVYDPTQGRIIRVTLED